MRMSYWESTRSPSLADDKIGRSSTHPTMGDNTHCLRVRHARYLSDPTDPARRSYNDGRSRELSSASVMTVQGFYLLLYVAVRGSWRSKSLSLQVFDK